MLPNSDVTFAKKFYNSNSNIGWTLYDIYKIASDFPLEISTYAHILVDEATTPVKYTFQRLKIMDKFFSKSTRDDLKGLKLRCARVVCTHLFFRHIAFLIIGKKKIFEKNKNWHKNEH